MGMFSGIGSLSVGDRIPKLRTNEIMVLMDYDDGIGWKLIVGYPEMTKAENDSFVKGSFMSAFTVLEDTPFFLFSFDNGPWMDAPFEPRIDSSLPRFEPTLEAGTGIGLLIMSVDTKYGEIMGFRQVGLSHVLSMKLLTTMRDFQQRPAISREKYRANVERAYSIYSSSEEMLRTVNPNEIFAIIDAKK